MVSHAALIQWIMGLVLLAGAVIFARQIIHTVRPHEPVRSMVFRTLYLAPFVLWLVLATYQARWQMFGFLHPGFLRVQRGFDQREDLIGGRFKRGDIMDAHRRILARDRQTRGRLERWYPSGAASAHVIGYHHPVFGTSGLERVLDAQLMGRKLGSAGDIFRLAVNAFVHRRIQGNPVVLTLRRELQETAHQLLAGHTGAIVMLNPEDGAILAMASNPGFNPNGLDPATFETLSAQADAPFLNRCLKGLYPPGSTFKPLLAARMLELGFDPEIRCGPDGFHCGPGEPVLYDYDYHAARQRGTRFTGHGVIRRTEAMARSCNVFFASVGAQMGSYEITEIAHRAGLDARIKPAGKGLVSDAGRFPADGNLHKSRTARLAIGQDDLLVTPLHLAMVAGALGTDGTMYAPRYLMDTQPGVWRQVTDKRTAVTIARDMIYAVESGTGSRARIPGIVIGGKTGTAENATGTSHALFIGFAPWPAPRVAVAVVLEQAGTGGMNAAPLAKKLFQAADDAGLFFEDAAPVPDRDSKVEVHARRQDVQARQEVDGE